jgi:ParB-like chromosome segregation protein Spo0J
MTDFADPATAETASVPADDQIKQLRERAARLGCRLRKRRGKYWLSDKDDEGGGTGFENLEDAAAEIGRRERGDPFTVTTECGMPTYTYDPKTGRTTNHLDEQMDPAESRVSWRDHLPVHPAADLFPLMSESELRELGEDIKARGLLSPICLDGGKLLDGRNRLDAMELVGIEFELRRERNKFCLNLPKSGIANGALELAGSFDGDQYDYVLSANLHRRHLTSEQKRELIAKVLKAKPEVSNATIAKQTKTTDKTVAKVRRKLESTSEIPRLEKTTGADGRQRKARPKKPPKPADRRVTESPQISLEQRRAENAEPDLSAEERAAKASASALAEFTVACRAWLPKVTVEADRQTARNLVATLTCSKCREAA